MEEEFEMLIFGIVIGLIIGLFACLITFDLTKDAYHTNPIKEECNQMCIEQNYTKGEYKKNWELDKKVCECIPLDIPKNIIKIYD